MVGEENSHYTGKVKKYEDGKVLFRLDRKIGGFRRASGKMKRDILFDKEDFYKVVEMNRDDKIKVGNKYSIDRKYLSQIGKEILAKRGKVNSIDNEIELSEADLAGIGEQISGTGIAELLSADDEED